MGKRIIILLTLLLNISFAAPLSTLTLTTKVTQAALKNPFGNFMNYKVIGSCFWLDWDSFGSFDVTTPMVDHFLPDAVISVFNNLGDNPWDYGNTVVDKLAHSVTGERDGGTSGMEKFKEVDIVGYPGIADFAVLFDLAIIPSKATPLMPYYSSMLDDAMWREPLVEDALYPEYLLPGVRIVGDKTDPWGNIFPRMGFVNQMGDFKAAGVLALRAADIATNANQPHLYNPLPSGSCGHECDVYQSHENDFEHVKFQEVYPKASTSASKLFGVNDLADPIPFGQDQLEDGNGNYVFVMWRRYRGCIQGPGHFIGSVRI